MSLEEAKKKKQGKMKKRYIFRFSILIVLLGAIIYALVMNVQEDKELYQEGDEAPDFELTQINENNEEEIIRLSELKGKGVMLNFWATYCAPCEAEMPFMESLYPEYKDDIEIVAVSLDGGELVIQRFIDKYDLSFPVVHDTDSDVLDLYSVGPIPTTFFINPEGEIEEEVAGALTLEKLEGHFNDILPEDSDIDVDAHEDDIDVGDQAPSFEAEQVNNNNDTEDIILDDIAGKGVIVNFWESDSDLSKEGLSFIESLYSEYNDDIEVIAVNGDEEEIDLDSIIDEKDLSYPIVRDIEHDILDLYDRTVFPSTFFIDEDGKVTDIISGELSEEKIDKAIQDILPE